MVPCRVLSVGKETASSLWSGIVMRFHLQAANWSRNILILLLSIDFTLIDKERGVCRLLPSKVHLHRPV